MFSAVLYALLSNIYLRFSMKWKERSRWEKKTEKEVTGMWSVSTKEKKELFQEAAQGKW